RHGDHERPARDLRRHGAALGSFFRNEPTVLAESSEPLRNSVGRRKKRKGHQEIAVAETGRRGSRVKKRAEPRLVSDRYAEGRTSSHHLHAVRSRTASG